ncbi:MAG: helix-turn-helix transcriptional regulator [Bacteroidota bacterium]
MPTQTDFQQLLLREILKKYARKSDATSALEKVLSVGRDSISRRLRGDTSLTAQEVFILARHYQISLDQLVHEGQQEAIFRYNGFGPPITNFLDYLHQIHHQISVFSQRPNFQVRYATREIPIFIYMMFPKLLTFKLYVYGQTTWKFDYLNTVDFHFDLLTPQELGVAKETASIYCANSSKDYWTITILEQTLNQLEYMVIAGRIKEAATALALVDAFQKMIDHAQAMAAQGQKFLPGRTPNQDNGRFELFYNEFADTNNMILATSDQQAALFHTFDTPNFLFTTDSRICTTVENWFDTTLGNSTSISVHSGLNRNKYFNRLSQRLEQTKRRMELAYT